MFGWRRKNDGFDWHEYVRTTIKLRRGDRRKRLEDLKFSAVAGAREAGRAGASAGRSAAGRLFDVIWRIPGLLFAGISALGQAIAPVFGWLGGTFGAGMRKVTPLLSKKGMGPLLILLAAAAMISAVGGYLTSGWNLQTVVSGVLAALLLVLAIVPIAASRYAAGPLHLRMPRVSIGALPNMGAIWAYRPGRGVLAAVCGLLIAGGAAAAFYAYAPQFSVSGAASSLANLTRPTSINVSGRAKAVTGDTLLIAGQHVRLADIEAPELGQVCRNSRRRRWRCGRTARRALARLISRREVSCQVAQLAEAGNRSGHCTVRGKDIGEQLVKAGHVFTTGGLYTRYGAAERIAKSAKSGIWSGTAQHPSDYRNAVWAKAKSRAPDGCPIKGRVSSKGKIYLFPWSPGYRRERINAKRGERWFCSERDALAAGWQRDPAG